MDEILDIIYSFFTEAVTHLTPAPVDKPIDARYLEFLYWVSTKWLLMAAGGFLLIILLYVHVRPFKKALNWILDNCLVAMILVVWVMGFITYTVGAHIPNENHFFDVAPMAMIHATEMFLSMSDISAIHSDCYNSARFMTLFNLSHFFAIALSMVFVIKKFGHNLIARTRLWLVSWFEYWFGFSKKDVYVFWGLNDASFCLAKDIIEHSDNLGKYYVVFVRTPEGNDDEDSKMGISRIFNMSSFKNREIERLKELEDMGGRVYSTSSYQRLSLMQFADGEKDIKILRDKLRLKSLLRLMGIHVVRNQLRLYNKIGLRSLLKLLGIKTGRSKMHLFLLGKDMNANIQATINMLKDEWVRHNDTKIYCRARKSAKTHWLEYYEYCYKEEKTKVSIIDTSELSVSQLKHDVANHPVKLIEFDQHTATAKSPFNCLVIGFGGTGQEAVNFLYEFSAFIDPQGKKSGFHCTVIDENMERYVGTFNALYPAFVGTDEFDLCSCNINSKEYWDKIRSIIDNLDYVVVALGNDDITLETIANLCKMAIRWRSSTDKELHIHVRSYSETDCDQLSTMCEDITRKYNKSKQSENVKDEDLNIFVDTFGSMNKIFTFDNIISEKILDEAKEYNLEYKRIEYENEKSKLIGKGCKINPFDDNKERQWAIGLGVKKGDNISYSIVELDEIERKLISNLSNSMHANTKIHILQDKCKLKDLYGPIDAKIIDSLAIIEHERWVAQMKLKGWQLTPYEGLDGKTKKIKKYRDDICTLDNVNPYDIMVVDTSIELYKKNLEKEKNNEKK